MVRVRGRMESKENNPVIVLDSEVFDFWQSEDDDLYDDEEETQFERVYAY